ncbi:MAG: hypothetical protein LBD46_03130 [Endomicrobium sp.]|jgi:hypothetical protein|nr:hypothetical protein [Endomicrobium sp.]
MTREEISDEFRDELIVENIKEGVSRKYGIPHSKLRGIVLIIKGHLIGQVVY